MLAEIIVDSSITKPHLEQLEQVVRDGLQSFMAVGLALIEIREAKGYRLRDFDTFEDYTQQTFGFTARHGRRMMQAARTATEIAVVTGQQLQHESAARVLVPVAHNPDAIRHIKARLAARGETFGSAPAAVISGILGEVMAAHPKPPLQSRLGECPECAQTPRAYRNVDGYWQCGNCGADVLVKVLPVRKIK